jgi:hypothetical protein
MISCSLAKEKYPENLRRNSLHSSENRMGVGVVRNGGMSETIFE